MTPGPVQGDGSQAGAWLPQFSTRNRSLVMERGLHQEIGWKRTTDRSSMSIVVFSDISRTPCSRRFGPLLRALRVPPRRPLALRAF